MKKYNITYYFLPMLLLLLSACEKEDLGLSVSRVTEFPEFVMEGDPLIIISPGEDFQDPGVTAFEGDTELPVEVEGSVNTDEVGHNVITYTAVNSDGFPASTTREVVVTRPEVADTDLSGQYQGAGFGSDIATVAQLGRGYYEIDKALASGNNIRVRFIHVEGDELLVYEQSTPFGLIATGDGYPDTFARITDTGFEWVIFIGCCGNFGPITFTSL